MQQSWGGRVKVGVSFLKASIEIREAPWYFKESSACSFLQDFFIRYTLSLPRSGGRVKEGVTFIWANTDIIKASGKPQDSSKRAQLVASCWISR